MEPNRTTLIFLTLVVLAFLGSIYATESFVDASGTMVTVSLKDLLQVFGLSQTVPNYNTIRDDLEKKQKESLLNDASTISSSTAATTTTTPTETKKATITH